MQKQWDILIATRCLPACCVLNMEFEDLEVADFWQALEEVTPVAKDFADSVVVAFIKAYVRNHIAELVPFARTLD